MRIKQTQINKARQKPIDYDLHIKYVCSECSSDHWLSLLEASTINFKVVCICGTVFKVKRPIGLKLIYSKKKNAESSKVNTIDPKANNILQQSTNILIGYGFSKDESVRLLKKYYDTDGVSSVSDLVKKVLESLRGKNESLNETV